MKKKWQRIATVFLSCFILLFLSAPAVAAYRLTGHEADDIIAVAEAQVGKAAGEFGFNGAWCGRFLSWCAKQTGSTHVSHNITGGFTAVEYMVEGGLGDFYCFSDSKTNTTGQSIYKYLSTYNKNGHAISKSGMTRVHERDRNSFAPKKD